MLGIVANRIEFPQWENWDGLRNEQYVSRVLARKQWNRMQKSKFHISCMRGILRRDEVGRLAVRTILEKGGGDAVSESRTSNSNAAIL